MIKPLPVTEANYAAVNYVGTTPAEGIAQLEILKRFGLQPHHDVLEIGCGALIAGYPIMQYIEFPRYYGIDPNKWLFEASIRVPDVAQEMRPMWYWPNADFRAGAAPALRPHSGFDYVLSHSILSHTSDAQLTDFLRAVAEQLRPGGQAAVSLRLAEGNEFGSPGSAKHGADFTEWQYPGVSWFRRDDVFERARAAGLSARVEPEFTKMILDANPKSCHDWLVLAPL
jgi:cyclopropane fatty-acyl-phospholipid synthase-like methyltransferase